MNFVQMSFALGLKRLILQRIALFHSTKLTLGILRVLLCSFNDCITYFVFQINMFREFYHSIRPNIPLCKFCSFPGPPRSTQVEWRGEERNLGRVNCAKTKWRKKLSTQQNFDSASNLSTCKSRNHVMGDIPCWK